MSYLKTSNPKCWRESLLVCPLIATTLVLSCSNAIGQQIPIASEQRCIVVELYVSNSDALSKAAIEAADRYAKKHRGVRLAIRSVDDSEKARSRLRSIADHFRFDAQTTPVVYACNRVILAAKDANDFYRQITDALTMEVFTRHGCQRCKAAKAYLPSFAHRYPGLRIIYREISGDSIARNDLNDLVRRHRKASTSTPIFHLCNQLIVGFDRPQTTGARLSMTIDRWTAACPEPSKQLGRTNLKHSSSAREVAAGSPF